MIAIRSRALIIARRNDSERAMAEKTKSVTAPTKTQALLGTPRLRFEEANHPQAVFAEIRECRTRALVPTHTHTHEKFPTRVATMIKPGA